MLLSLYFLLHGPTSNLGNSATVLQLAVLTPYMAGLTYATGLGPSGLLACPCVMLPSGLWAGPPCKGLPEVAPEVVLIVCVP